MPTKFVKKFNAVITFITRSAIVPIILAAIVFYVGISQKPEIIRSTNNTTPEQLQLARKIFPQNTLPNFWELYITDEQIYAYGEYLQRDPASQKILNLLLKDPSAHETEPDHALSSFTKLGITLADDIELFIKESAKKCYFIPPKTTVFIGSHHSWICIKP